MSRQFLEQNTDIVVRMAKLWAKYQRPIFDATITGPPYNISRKDGGFASMNRPGIDFGEWDYNFGQVRWPEVATPLFETRSS